MILDISNIDQSLFESLKTDLINAKSRLNLDRQNIEFIDILSNIDKRNNTYNSIVDLSQSIDSDLKNIIVVGIGGSDLGARAVHEALNHTYFNESHNRFKIYFTGDTTDPRPLLELLEVVDLTKSLIFVVSKSGSTVEPAVVFNILLSKVRAFEPVNWQRHFVFITDPQEGILRSFATKNSVRALGIPSGVGGRYSVLTAAGLAPLFFMESKLSAILEGASEFVNETFSPGISMDLALKFAAVNYFYYKKGYNLTVLMSYVYSLKSFGSWFRQLWAESLGKAGLGSTPLVAIGPTDQHSQLQLYNDGPKDKLLTFIKTSKPKVDIRLPILDEEYSHLSGKSMSEVLDIEHKATELSLTDHGVPNITLIIDQLDGHSLGRLFAFFELSVVYLGYLYNINVFDQPGVEQSKSTIRDLLSNVNTL